MVGATVAKGTSTKSSRRKSREQRRRDREQSREVESRVVDAPEVEVEVDPPANALAAPPKPSDPPTAYVQPGVMEKLFGGGRPKEDPGTGLVEYRAKPGLLRPFARRSYQREAALASIRHGFEDLSDLMADIRDGLHDSVDRQGDLLEQLKYLPVLAEQNTRSSERFEEQFRRNNDELARSNELSGENLRVQTEALRQQADAVKALRDGITGQRDQADRLDKVLTGMGKESRDQKRDVDDLQGRLDRMRQSDQQIADNLGGVAAAIRRVNDQSAVQGEVVARLQQAMDERTRRLEEEVRGRGRAQGWLLFLAILLAFLALGSVAAVGMLYLRQQGMLGGV